MRTIRWKSCVVTGLLMAAMGVAKAAADTNDLFGPSVTVMQENDLVVRTDRHYTQGLKFNFLAREHAFEEKDYWAVRWADCFPALPMTAEAVRYGAGFGQNIYTPTDISTPALQVNDRPYAGFLYGELMLQRRGVTASQTPVLDHWQMDIGVMGPPSMAMEAQNTVHRLRKFGLAMGWGNQLTVEPGLALKYGRLWRFSTDESASWTAQFIPHTAISLGNVGTYGAVGGQVRAGYHVPRDFGWQTVDSILPGTGGKLPGQIDPNIGFYLFAGVEGRTVAYNAFLDGNLLHASHHVSKHPLVGDAKLGFVLVFRRCDIAFTQVIRSKEFVAQKEIDAFGSLALRIKW